MIILDQSPVCSDAEVLGGALTFRGTSVPVQTLLDYLNHGFAVREFCQHCPDVATEDIVAFLRLIGRTSAVMPSRNEDLRQKAAAEQGLAS
jgi:uncharacterized protein (DUF433 family)